MCARGATFDRHMPPVASNMCRPAGIHSESRAVSMSVKCRAACARFIMSNGDQIQFKTLLIVPYSTERFTKWTMSSIGLLRLCAFVLCLTLKGNTNTNVYDARWFITKIENMRLKF